MATPAVGDDTGGMPLSVQNFSHICISVSDPDRSLAFYRDALGLQPIFDKRLEGEGMESATGEAGAKGRMIGLKVPGPGGVTIELLAFAHRSEETAGKRRPFGYTNVSFCVPDLDQAHRELVASGVTPMQQPFEVGGVRMFFVADPDGTAIELIEFPGDATTSAEFNGA